MDKSVDSGESDRELAGLFMDDHPMWIACRATSWTLREKVVIAMRFITRSDREKIGRQFTDWDTNKFA